MGKSMDMVEVKNGGELQLMFYKSLKFWLSVF